MFSSTSANASTPRHLKYFCGRPEDNAFICVTSDESDAPSSVRFYVWSGAEMREVGVAKVQWFCGGGGCIDTTEETFYHTRLTARDCHGRPYASRWGDDTYLPDLDPINYDFRETDNGLVVSRRVT